MGWKRGKVKLLPDLGDVREAQFLAKEPPVHFTATPKQVELFEAWRTQLYNIMGMGGGIRGTKTIGCLMLLVLLSRIYARSRWAIVRTDLPTLRRNVIPPINQKIIPWSGGFVGALNQSTWTYKCANGSELLIFPEQFPQDPELDRWRGLEVNGFLLEEGNELNEKSANKAIERAGSWVIPKLDPGDPNEPEPAQPKPLVLVNFNPCIEWPRSWFYMPYKNRSIKAPYFFLPATIQDNPFATEEYKASLKNLPPDEYRRFVEGEWDFVDNPKQLIKAEWAWNAQNVLPQPGAFRMGADVARYGDDWTSIYKMRGNQLWGFVNIKHYDTIEVGNALLNLAADADSPVTGANVRVDAIGQGAGVYDYCKFRGLPLYEVVAGDKVIPRPGSFFRFKNLRSQMWWECREKLRKGELSLMFMDRKGNHLPLPEKLIGDLCAPEYEIDGDKVITVEPKDDIKERLHRSPDDGDAFVMAVFDFPARRPRPRRVPSVIMRGQGMGR